VYGGGCAEGPKPIWCVGIGVLAISGKNSMPSYLSAICAVSSVDTQPLDVLRDRGLRL
jgi:hypothetical protein